MNPIATFQGDQYAPLALYFTRDGQYLISGGMGKVLRRWRVPSWELDLEVPGHDNSVHTFAAVPDDAVLVSGSTDSTVKLWSLPDLALLRTLTDRKKTVSTVTLSADGQYIVASYYGGRVAIWRLDGESVLAFKANDRNVVNCQLSPDNRLLATGGLSDDIRIWSFPEGKPVATLTGHKTATFPILFEKGGRILLTQGYEGTLREWNTATWECTSTWQAPVEPIRSFTYSPDRTRVALATQGRVLVLDAQTRETLYDLAVGTPATGGVGFSHDNRYLAVGAADKNMRVWDLSEGENRG